MLRHLSTPDIANLFCIVLSLMVSCILFFYHSHRPAIRWLTLSYLMIALAYFDIFLLKTGLITDLPHFYRTGYVFAILYLPFSYLYIRSTVTDKRLSKWGWLHFLPATLYVIDYIPFFLSSKNFKLSIIRENLANSDLLFDFSEGMVFSDNYYHWLIVSLAVGYWIAQTVIVARVFRKNNSYKRANEYWVKWILFYLAFQLLILLPAFFVFISSETDYFFRIADVFAITSCTFIVLSFFIHPGLNSSEKTVFAPETKNPGEPLKTAAPEETKEKSIPASPHAVKPLQKLTKKQIIQMKYEIDTLLRRTQPYLQHGYSLQDMATSLSLPLYQLSALINQEYGTNFNELVNKYRIDYAINIIKEGKFSNLNINGLANQCGFNNRNSFTTAFKKFTGLTPSEYFKELEH